MAVNTLFLAFFAPPGRARATPQRVNLMWSKWFGLRSRRASPARTSATSSSGYSIGSSTHASPAQITLAAAWQRFLLDRPDPVISALPVPHRLLLQATQQRLADAAGRGPAVPRLPTIVPLLLKQIRDPEISTKELVEIIQRDPLLMAAVLKTANSAWFNPYRKPMESLERVLLTLGLDGLRLVLSTAVLQPILKTEGEQIVLRLWQHATATATASHALAPRFGASRFHGYLAGLIVNVGAVTAIQTAHALAQGFLDTKRADAAIVAELIQRDAATLGHTIARDWRMPPDIVDALGARAGVPTRSPLGRTLVAADWLSRAWLCKRAGLIDAATFTTLCAEIELPPEAVSDVERDLELVATDAAD